MRTTRPSSPRTIPVATLLASLIVGGCATPSARDAAVPEEPPADVFYTVERGDRLADIAREHTGDASLWTEIAAGNGIEDPRTLKVGAVLRIPAALIPGRADELAVASAELEAGGERRTPPAAAPGLALRQGAPVRLSPVDVNRRFELAPLERERRPGRRADASGTSVATDVPRRVRVVGSYTPKGIYSQPAVYSTLLMRVAPGTVLELERKVGDWYGVVTERGVGYLRDTDARLLWDEAAARRTVSSEGARG